jgi:hypothetical protein
MHRKSLEISARASAVVPRLVVALQCGAAKLILALQSLQKEADGFR